MKIALIGTGYVGLVTGTCFAEVGHEVICVDCDADKVKLLQQGGIPIYEPGLEELVRKNVAASRLRFTTSTREGVDHSQVVFIAVPTPPLPDGSVDLSFIDGVAGVQETGPRAGAARDDAPHHVRWAESLRAGRDGPSGLPL